MSMLLAPYGEYLIRMLLASLFGGLIGLERDIHGRAAGLRTHLLVSLGAALFTILSEIIARRSDGVGFSSDPARISAQIVTGIGFLGAGAIIKEGVNIRGLTTAACLWTVAAVGMAAGSGYFEMAAFTTLIALASLIVLKLVERFYRKDSYRLLNIATPIDVDASDVIDLVKRPHLKVLNCDIEKNYETGTTVTRSTIRLYHRGITDKLAHGIIDSLEHSSLRIREISWRHR